ncbi:MAG: UDP-3-O-[3-hydroxymyristoyl] N-acetylglucosamine deacetylase, partial [Planctomycetes bacterium]|nr:UDP-3-O-[3-hydroxymyristoyl] N-acetylglucosamine deacetylase [Planctomycetota bacterium]
MLAQQTIRCEVSVEGRGLFGGRPVQMRLKPAEPDSGIVFVRTDFPEPVRIPVGIEGLSEAPKRTVLQNGSASVETVEHFLAAVNGLGIDNLEAEINATELPNTDGSCELFTRALAKAGLLEQDVPSKPFVITEPLAVQVGNGHLYALPDRDDELNIIYDLDYQHVPVIGRQLRRFNLTPENFQNEISTARTFSTEEEAKQLQAKGFGLHLTGRDVLVLGPDGPIDNKLRFQDECVRHKIADLLGDIMLFGRAIRGRLVAYRSGHRCNHQLVRELLKSAQKHEPQTMTPTKTVLDIRKLQKILPHRYPFLLVDR